MIHQHPLGFLLGLEGVALLRAFAGEHDDAFMRARLDEVRALLERDWGDGVAVPPIAPAEAYDGWAAGYDDGDNDLVAVEQRAVWELLDALPRGVALDAACGTGRHAARLMELGHRVVGVDTSGGMLVQARAKVPGAQLQLADLHALPLDDDSVDLVVCGLALMHVPRLEPVFGEFARVLRPGGNLVVSDWRGVVGEIRMPLVKAGADGRLGYVPSWCRRTSEYIAAALPLGFELRRCEEPLRPSPVVAPGEQPPPHDPGEVPSIWGLMPSIPAAANAAFAGSPIAVVWQFQLGRAVGD